MSVTNRFKIDPQARLDYQFDWTSWLDAAETIIDYTITPTDGITVDADAEDAGIVTVWVTAATGRIQRVTCHIVTSEGREDDRTMTFTVNDR